MLSSRGRLLYAEPAEWVEADRTAALLAEPAASRIPGRAGRLASRLVCEAWGMVGSAAHQAWPAFVLVTGLLLVGLAAHSDGLFAQAGRLLERVPGSSALLMAASMALVTVVTAVLNLDTAVVFLTPVVVLAARQRGADEEPFLFSAVFMANASSLYLPGSNLTNLLVLAHDPVSGAAFGGQMLAPALTATLVTATGLLVMFAARLRGAGGALRTGE